MSLGWTTGFKVFEAKTTLGRREGYYYGYLNMGSTTARHHFCMGGDHFNIGRPDNIAPALADGSIKKLISSCYVNGGGRVDLFSAVNGLDIIEGNNPSLGKVTLDIDRTFVKDDLIGIETQRNNTNGTLTHGVFTEIEWTESLDNIQHWYGGLYRTGAGGVDGYFEIGQMARTGIFPLTPRKEFQRPMLKGGKILDYGFYGKSPVGVDNLPIFKVEINGSNVDNFEMGQSGSKAYYQKIGADISFSAGDLINLAGISADNLVKLDGFPCMRILFDD